MINLKMRLLASFFLVCSAVPKTAFGSDIFIAVASNFLSTMESLVEAYTLQSGHRVVVSSGSTGKQYAQILNGAPFDLFFAADDARPELLEQQGLVKNNSRYTYAMGKLVLWSPNSDYVGSNGAVLKNGQFKYLAIANPKLAPYGRASQEVLDNLRLKEVIAGRVVQGENVNQAMQFIKSGNAELGFVAYSQVIQLSKLSQGSMWNVPQELYTPIRQQVVQLTNTEAGSEFLAFIRSEFGESIIRRQGYAISEMTATSTKYDY